MECHVRFFFFVVVFLFPLLLKEPFLCLTLRTFPLLPYEQLLLSLKSRAALDILKDSAFNIKNGSKSYLTQPMNPAKKSLNFIFPTKYVIPKSLKFSHWLSELSNLTTSHQTFRWYLKWRNPHQKISCMDTAYVYGNVPTPNNRRK